MLKQVPYFVARITEDKDFFLLKELAENHDDWRLDYDKSTVKVWTKHVDDSSFNMVKVWALFNEVNCADLYDTLHDPEYRKEWDSHMIVGFDIGYLNPNNDISYYSMSCPAPLKNRDLVLQRSWLDMGTEFFILNHSVCHKEHPPRKGFVRAISYITGYFIKCLHQSRKECGCELHYVTRSDPQGDLPSWLVNKCTQIFAPRYMKQIEKAALQYAAWKNNHRPHYKPWIYPEQIEAPKISVRDCVPSQDEINMNPKLRDFDFENYYQLLEKANNSTKQVGKVGKSKKKKHSSPKTEHIQPFPTSREVHFQDTNPNNQQNRASISSAKRKNLFSRLLNLTKMCGGKAQE